MDDAKHLGLVIPMRWNTVVTCQVVYGYILKMKQLILMLVLS